MRAALVLCIAALLLLAQPAGGEDPGSPRATTRGATDITRNTATLEADVDAMGSATTFYFEYGTSSNYDRRTAEQSAGSGSGNVSVTATIESLSEATIYHYRVVATGPGGTALGLDATLRTSEPLRPPTVSTAGVGDVTSTSAILTGSIDPHETQTTFHFDYGPTAAYGSRTADITITGRGSRVVSQSVEGLAPATQYHYRMVAANAVGTSFGGDRSVTTLREPSSVSLQTARSGLPTWGDVVTLVGRVRGRGVGGMPLIISRDEFPFGSRIEEVARLTANADGTFRVRIGPLRTHVRLRALADSPSGKRQSPTVDLPNRVSVGLIRGSASPSSVAVAGLVRPKLPGAHVSIKRQTAGGGWKTLARGALFDDQRGRSRYSFTIRRPLRSAAIRVVVVPDNRGRHLRGISRIIKIRGRL